MALQDALYLLDQLGFTDVFLPFILIFTIVFGTLQKVKIFGEGDNKKFNSIIALSLAIGVVIPHSLGKYPPGTDIVQILNTALPNISLFIVAIVFFLVFIGLFGGSASWGSGWMGGLVTVISLAVLAFIFGNAAGWWEASGAMNAISDPNIQATLIIIIVFWMIISTITKEDNSPGALDELGTFFGAAAKQAAKKEGEKKQ